jgi:hypothetical protein
MTDMIRGGLNQATSLFFVFIRKFRACKLLRKHKYKFSETDLQ